MCRLLLPDFDECARADDNDCDTHASCNNTVGAYTCECGDGYIPNADGRTCSRMYFECFGYILTPRYTIVGLAITSFSSLLQLS